MARIPYRESIFLNVPFDRQYRRLMEALVFAIYECGFVARSALESDDAAVVRIHKIQALIRDSKYGIHDISRTEPDRQSRLPRFNMPFESGLFLGARAFGTRRNRTKRALVLDRKPYRYQKFLSDIAGQDIRSHENSPERVICRVRDWLRGSPDTACVILPGGKTIWRRYRAFQRQLPKLCRRVQLDRSALHFNDYATLVAGWLKENPR
jgi:hypothetical protein